MIEVVLPIFLVVLVGYIFGIKNKFSNEAEALINTYVLFVALPALLFLSVAQANASELLNLTFVIATLVGIFVSYLAGVIFAKVNQVTSPQSSIVGMASCYGTTGYMGIPILIMAFGPSAAVPAAIATILHNIPAIMCVIITNEISSSNKKSTTATFLLALKTTLKNPLTIAVIAGVCFSYLNIPLPKIIFRASDFLADAAGPTALFALGIGLSHIKFDKTMLKNKYKWVISTISFKVILQPVITLFVIAYFINGFDINNIWHISAIIMAAQPIGAGVYVFAKKYNYFSEEISISIIASLIITLFTISYLLTIYS